MIQIGKPAAGLLKYSSSSTNVVCDGNSLTIGAFASGPSMYYPAQMAALAPISGQFTVTNLGVSGQTARMMNGLDGGSTGDVDSSFVSGKKNVLLAWEGTNSIDAGGRTGTQAAQDMADYIAARLALNPWLVVVLTTLPLIRNSDTQTVTNQKNGYIDTYNAIMRSSYRAWGAKVCVDLRNASSPFALPDYTLASFEVSGVSGLWASGEGSGQHIHLNDSGYGWVAAQCAVALRRVPVR